MEKNNYIIDNKDLFLTCYNLCLDSNFDDNLFLPLVKKEGLNPDTVKNNAVKYMINSLKLSDEKINEHYDFFISSKIKKMLNDYKKLIFYLIINNVISSKVIYDYFWLSSNLEVTILKASYDVCDSVNWDNDLVNKKSREFNINSNLLLNMAIEYRKIFFKENDKEVTEYINRKKRSNPNNKKENSDLFDKLLRTEKEDEIIKIFSKIDALEINKKIFLLENLIDRSDYDKIEKEIMRKLDIYLNYKKMKGVDSKEAIFYIILEARSVIEDFISYKSTNVEEFCKFRNILLQQFGDYLALIKINDVNLYNKYLNKINAINKKR